jgi:two-component system phosphate regulon sensor histidine kinase PhoR
MNAVVVFNAVVLVGFLALMVREEVRYRRFNRLVTATKADLIAIVHQLRTPLGTLRKFTDFLQSKEFGSLTFAQQEALSAIRSSQAELLLLLDRFMARSQLNEEQVTMQPASLKVRDIVQGVVHAVTPFLNDRRHTLTITGGNGLRIVADPLLLHAILDEILANAVYYTPVGGTIRVAIADRGKTIDIDVSDTGIGISDEEYPRIFEKFFRGERAKPMHAGNGLGLPFAKQFVDSIGGSIRCSSVEGKGSTFTVTVPKKAISRLDEK